MLMIMFSPAPCGHASLADAALWFVLGGLVTESIRKLGKQILK